MIKKVFFICSTAILSCLAVKSQDDIYQLNDLILKDLSGFNKAPSNWTIAGNVSASFTDTVFKSSSGTGVLLDQYNKSIQFKPGTNLFSAFEHGDLYLELDFMMPRGSNSGIYFQSRYEIQLFDSWGVKNPKYLDCGAIYQRWDEKRPEGEKGYEGHPPLKNACFAPGLWQHLQVSFEAPKFDASGKKIQSARFRKVILNGVVIHENIILTGPTRASAFEDEKALAPLMIQGDHGMVAFRNIKYASLADWQAGWKSLSYEYYEGKFDGEESLRKSKPTRSGQTKFIDSRLADANDNYHLSFRGILQVPETSEYFFYMRVTGAVTLEIDGKTVIPVQWTWIRGDLLKGKAQLTAGEHQVTAWCNKQVNWAPPGWGLYISKPNSKIIPLHSLASLPEIPHAPLIEVEPAKETELVRSFYMYADKKLTHVISVGDPAGAHYAYDLEKGSMISIWKGDFLNTTDMWYERGEPQTSSPLGAAIIFDNYTFSVTDIDRLQDSLSELKYSGYWLTDNRSPVFHYRLRDAEITDSITAWQDGKGLFRSIKIKGNTGFKTPVFPLAQGENFTDLGNGIYAVNNQQYYLQIISPTNLSVQNGANNKKILVAEGTSQSIQYALIW